VEQCLAQVRDRDAAAGAVDPVGDHGRAGGDPVVPVVLSRAATTLATSLPWEQAGVATAGPQPVSVQRMNRVTRPARSAIPVTTPASTTATVWPVPVAPPSWAATTLAPWSAPWLGWRCQQAPGSQSSTRRSQSGSADPTPGRPASRRAAARTSAPRSSSTTRVRPGPARTSPSTAAAAARRPRSPAPAANRTSTRPGTNPSWRARGRRAAAPGAEASPCLAAAAAAVAGAFCAWAGSAAAAAPARGRPDNSTDNVRMRASEVRPGSAMGEVIVRVGVRFHDWIGRNAPELTPQQPQFRGGSGGREAQVAGGLSRPGRSGQRFWPRR
jgi:hypothetical protein